MNDKERFDKAAAQALALSHALDHLSGVLSSIGSDDLFEVISVQIATNTMDQAEDDDVSPADLVNISNRIKTYIDLVAILQMIFSGMVHVTWDKDSSGLKFSLTTSGIAKAKEIMSKIGV